MKVLVALALLVAACGGGASERPGSPEVYERISSLTDCDALRKEFDTAKANAERDRAAGRQEQASWGTAYMRAADERMKDLRCYWRHEP